MRRAKLLVKQYAEYEVFGAHVNGELCLGENVADLGGVKLAYIGLQRFMKVHGRPADLDGFTPEQRFFLGWATVWRNNIRKENALKRIVMDRESGRAILQARCLFRL
jgi:putative endopeptidase